MTPPDVCGDSSFERRSRGAVGMVRRLGRCRGSGACRRGLWGRRRVRGYVGCLAGWRDGGGGGGVYRPAVGGRVAPPTATRCFPGFFVRIFGPAPGRPVARPPVLHVALHSAPLLPHPRRRRLPATCWSAAPAWRRRRWRCRRPSDGRPCGLIPSPSRTPPSRCFPPPPPRETPPSLTTEASSHSNSRLPRTAVAKSDVRRPPTHRTAGGGGGRSRAEGRRRPRMVGGPPPPSRPARGRVGTTAAGAGQGGQVREVRGGMKHRWRGGGRRAASDGGGRPQPPRARRRGARPLPRWVPASRPAGCDCRWGAALARKGRAVQIVLPSPSLGQRWGKPQPRLPSRPPQARRPSPVAGVARAATCTALLPSPPRETTSAPAVTHHARPCHATT